MFNKPFRGFSNSHNQTRVNERIRAREMLVIDPDGKPLGVLSLGEAITTARRHGLDLVEVAGNANPPVCKIVDYGKYRYEQAKKDRDSKKGVTAQKVKELKFHINIDQHDYDTKLRHAEQFMFKGMRVKFLLVMRGREMIHKDLGEQLIRRVRDDMVHIGVPDAEPKLIGKTITMMLTPLPAQKRVRKFTQENDEELEEVLENGVGGTSEEKE